MTSTEAERLLDEPDALRLLRRGELELEGRLVDASNTTLRAFVTLDGVTRRCVYKPVRGERPLWDFPDGTLAGREVSAYLVSSWMAARDPAFGLIPPTILRDGPLGPGACQLWIDEPGDAEQIVGFIPAWELPAGWFRIASAEDDDGERYALAHADDERLARLAVLDAVLNNADRKGGHVLLGPSGRIFGVDHGICFHTEEKLRTVLWGWAGKRLPGWALAVLEELRTGLRGDLGESLDEHLTQSEVDATRRRVARLIARRKFPDPPEGWPAVPWPPI
ncbi:SCO1664 family protein [Catenuloplanes japonicus]|uniref:SCO1664 family protein n=1 Tax=Catenuloplanes japonicus TaxID=33876 RepID=UPI0005278E07|nr:SCO1664 family protein [Catenuloplanes japonicus]